MALIQKNNNSNNVMNIINGYEYNHWVELDAVVIGYNLST